MKTLSIVCFPLFLAVSAYDRLLDLLTHQGKDTPLRASRSGSGRNNFPAVALCLAVILIGSIARGEERALVFLLAGQSNMGGMGVAAEIPAEMKVMPQNVTLIVNGRNVKGFPQGNFGPEVGIALELGKRLPQRRVVLVKFAVGGTSQLAWSPEYDAERVQRINFSHDVRAGSLYPKMVAEWKQAFPDGTVRPDAILWMQGESDAILSELGHEYRANIERLITHLRQDLQAPEAPFIIGEINPPLIAESIHYKFPAVNEVIAAQRAAAKEMKQVFIVTTGGLGKRPDEVHYNTDGQLELGKRFAQRLLEVLPKQ